MGVVLLSVVAPCTVSDIFSKKYFVGSLFLFCLYCVFNLSLHYCVFYAFLVINRRGTLERYPELVTVGSYLTSSENPH
jgi:hypothetical protein